MKLRSADVPRRLQSSCVGDTTGANSERSCNHGVLNDVRHVAAGHIYFMIMAG